MVDFKRIVNVARYLGNAKAQPVRHWRTALDTAETPNETPDL
jgi:hypothetical protein